MDDRADILRRRIASHRALMAEVRELDLVRILLAQIISDEHELERHQAAAKARLQA